MNQTVKPDWMKEDRRTEIELAERQTDEEARALVLKMEPHEHIRPRDLQRATKGGISFNAACRVLERLQVDGELVRLGSGEGLVWRRSQRPGKPPTGYALPLSSREHAALLRLLDWELSQPAKSAPGRDDFPLLRAIRSKMKRPA